MARKDYDRTRAADAAATTGMSEDAAKALAKIREDIEDWEKKFSLKFPMIEAEEVSKMCFAQLKFIKAFENDLKSDYVKYLGRTTPSTDDDVVVMWAYTDINGKVQYAKTRAEALDAADCDILRADEIRHAYVVQQKDGTYKEVSDPT